MSCTFVLISTAAPSWPKNIKTCKKVQKGGKKEKLNTFKRVCSREMEKSFAAKANWTDLQDGLCQQGGKAKILL